MIIASWEHSGWGRNPTLRCLHKTAVFARVYDQPKVSHNQGIIALIYSSHNHSVYLLFNHPFLKRILLRSKMIAGYARVSTKDQSVDVQVAQLRALGCDEIYTDHISGKNMNRAGLKACLKRLQTGDTLIVQAYDRLGRSVSDLLNITEGLREKGVEFKSIRENVDTSTPLGVLFFNISSSFAQFERDLISQRTKIGLEAARAQGRVGGRPKLLTNDQLKEIEETIIGTPRPFLKISKQYGVSVATLYKAFPGGRAALVKTRFKIVSDYSYGQECFQIIEDTKGSGFYWRVSAEGAASQSSPMGPFPSLQSALDECAGLASGAI